MDANEARPEGRQTREELLRFFQGLEKKHGKEQVEVVVKVRTGSGKVRRRNGWYLGVRGDAEVGLRNDARSADTWYALDQIHDAWKRGSEPSGG